jgi:hypothetical protein
LKKSLSYGPDTSLVEGGDLGTSREAIVAFFLEQAGWNVGALADEQAGDYCYIPPKSLRRNPLLIEGGAFEDCAQLCLAHCRDECGIKGTADSPQCGASFAVGLEIRACFETDVAAIELIAPRRFDILGKRTCTARIVLDAAGALVTGQFCERQSSSRACINAPLASSAKRKRHNGLIMQSSGFFANIERKEHEPKDDCGGP